MAFSCSSRPSLSSSPADAKHPRLCPSSPLGEKIYFPRFALSLQCRRKSLWSLPQTNNLVVWDPQVSHAGLYRISWAQKCCEFGFFSVLPLTSVPSQLHNGGILLWLHHCEFRHFFFFYDYFSRRQYYMLSVSQYFPFVGRQIYTVCHI